MPAKLTQEEFIKRLSIYSDKYDFSESKFLGINKKVKIICKIHNTVFYSSPNSMFRGIFGCKKCTHEIVSANGKKQVKDLSFFLEKAIKTHGDKFDYSLVNYTGALNKVKIICKIHGVFEQTCASHWSGCGCPKCRGARISEVKLSKRKKINSDYLSKKQQVEKREERNKLKLEEYLSKSRNKYKDTFDYTLVKSNDFVRTTLICKKHNKIIKIQWSKHLIQECGGCITCSKELFSFKTKSANLLYRKEKFENWKKKYENNYILGNPLLYMDAEFISIHCTIHNTNYKSNIASLYRSKTCCCHDCNNDSLAKARSFTTEEFISKSKIVHCEKYSYEKSIYKNARLKLIITCPIHGDFKQDGRSHLQGCGCPICDSSKGELAIFNYLKQNKLYYKREYRFPDCKDKRPLPFDFAIFYDKEKTKLKCLIEFDGIQHFKAIEWFGGEKSYLSNVKRDTIKNNYCLFHAIPLFRIPYWQEDNIPNLLSNYLSNV